jgi:hypothetical protein
LRHEERLEKPVATAATPWPVQSVPRIDHQADEFGQKLGVGDRVGEPDACAAARSAADTAAATRRAMPRQR